MVQYHHMNFMVKYFFVIKIKKSCNYKNIQKFFIATNSHGLVINLGSSKEASFRFQIQEGTFTVSVGVFDDYGSNYIFSIPTSIIVKPNPTLSNDLSKITSLDPNSDIMKQLFSGNSQDTLRVSNLISASLKNIKFNNSVNFMFLNIFCLNKKIIFEFKY
jgi:hypothetical protein